LFFRVGLPTKGEGGKSLDASIPLFSALQRPVEKKDMGGKKGGGGSGSSFFFGGRREKENEEDRRGALVCGLDLRGKKETGGNPKRETESSTEVHHHGISEEKKKRECRRLTVRIVRKKRNKLTSSLKRGK